MKVSNAKSRSFVQNCLPFHANNLFAEQHGTRYIVFSYGYHWPLFVYDSSDKKWYENSDRYSVSTSKHRSQSHPLCDTVKISVDEIKKMY
jgi:hypothetical protein